MQIETIEVSYSRKVQLDQFEPVEYGESITAFVENDDDRDEVIEELQEMVENDVENGLLDRIMVHKMQDKDDD